MTTPAEIALNGAEVLWTIYKHPLDFPEKYVMRRWIQLPEREALPEAKPVAVGDGLNEVRLALPLGLTRVPRQEWQDQVIVETWI